MESQKINRLKVVLVENGKTGKWLAEQVGKNEATLANLSMAVIMIDYGKEESYKERGELPQS